MPQPAPIGKFYFTFSIAGGEIIHIRPKKKHPPIVVNGTSCSISRWLFTMYNMHDGCKCVWTARMRCPEGENCRRRKAVFTPTGQKLTLLANRPYGRRSLSPFGQKLCFCPIPLQALGGFHHYAESSMV